MRILICSFTFPPQANGVAEVVREHAVGLAAHGHQVTVATKFDPARAATEPLPGVTVREFKIQRDSRPAPGELAATREYQELLIGTDAEVLLCHCWGSWPVDLALPVLARSRARKIFVSHGFAPHIRNPQPRFPWGWWQWLRRQPYVWRLPRKMRAFDHLVFLSARVDRSRFFDHWLLDRFGGPNWSVIPNGTWPERFTERRLDFRQEQGLRDEFLVLNVGLYALNKGQEATLRAFSASRASNAVLIFIGNELNDYARHLQQLAARLPLGPGSSVRFLDQQPREHIRAAYQAADLFLLTSQGETQPLVLLDAMACGLPFLSTDVGCVSEFPGGITVRHPDELPASLRSLRADAPRRQRLAQLGLAAAHSTYHWPKIIKAYDQLIQKLTIAPIGRISRA